MRYRDRLTLGAAAAAVTLPLLALPGIALAEEAAAEPTPKVVEAQTAQDALDQTVASLVASSQEEDTNGTVAAVTVEAATDTAAPCTSADVGAGATGAAEVAAGEDGGEAAEADVPATSEAVSPTAAQTGTAAAKSNSIAPAKAARVATTTSASVSPVVTVTDGLYEIHVGTNDALRLDVSGGSTANGGAVQTWGDNATAAQRWRIAAAGGGYYTIQNVNSGKYLDVPSGKAQSATGLQQYTGNGTEAQLWRIVADAKRDGRVVLQSKLNSSLVLDVSGGSASGGARVQLWQANSTLAQSFLLQLVDQSVADGVYTIANAGSGRALDVSNASIENGGNVQQWSGNGTLAQSYRITYDGGTGYYTIVSAQSGKVLDVSGGRAANGTNVQQWASNGTRAQQWAIESVGGGAWRIRSSIDGRVLDVSGGSKASGANVQTYDWNGTGAQRWTLSANQTWLPEGSYEIVSALNHANAVGTTDRSYGTAGATTLSGAPSDPFRKWYLTRNDDGTYRITSIGSGLALTMTGSSNGAAIQQQAWTGTAGQRWTVSVELGGLVLRSALSGTRVADVSGGSTATGARLQTYASNGTLAQRFLARRASLYAANQSVVIHAKANTGRVADVTGGSTADGAVVQFYDANGTMAQLYYLEDAGSGQVRVINARSGKYLSAGSDGTVTQVSSRHSSSTLWVISWDDAAGGLRIVSASTGKALAYGQATGSLSAKAQLATPSAGSAAQAMLLDYALPVNYEGTRLHGMDISKWQAGIDLSKVAGDFVIIKATEGTSYTNLYYQQWANQALALGKKLGFYHFVDVNVSAADQARYFVGRVGNYVGRAVLVLDWENRVSVSGSVTSNAISTGPGFAKEFLDTVHSLTGVRPLVYMSRSVTTGSDWSAVSSSGYGLWLAQYLDGNVKASTWGHVDNPTRKSGSYGSWSGPVMYQYTSKGRLSGYGSDLDLDVFYGDGSAWDYYARAQ